LKTLPKEPNPATASILTINQKEYSVKYIAQTIPDYTSYFQSHAILELLEIALNKTMGFKFNFFISFLV
jgi:hypothetical protein